MLARLFITFLSLAPLASTASTTASPQCPMVQGDSRQHEPTQNVQEQIDWVQKRLHPSFKFNIARGNPHPGASTSIAYTANLPINPEEAGCIPSMPLPPNVYDCEQLLITVSVLNTTLEVPKGYCSTVKWRSCVMYGCATPCKEISFRTEEWAKGLDMVRWECIVGRGMSGVFYGKEGVRYVAGIENVGGLEGRVPPFWPCWM
ncbi:hypothetical protein K458DRAFT_167551 [Lentithecium fluviatile CBS 122367]|uniref:Ecp2 effector protein domain-containing protein n=1 Tax=Lentithecium fluviatile CBS 122367 TaxID=1168545 RepID=A0A6G1JBP9_9PLEO|nr:hypothetical protein K458DRAFT_167551 [Lentithecium fluviatile CBS 122367]